MESADLLQTIAELVRRLSKQLNSSFFRKNRYLVREIVPAEAISKTPHFPPCVLGVTRIRGDTLAVVDLALLMGN